ncbi:MAG: endonuclease [Deltaproteobacteria bacterium]|nr:endonuclease [Deltaproteobacteria bacterium]
MDKRLMYQQAEAASRFRKASRASALEDLEAPPQEQAQVTQQLSRVGVGSADAAQLAARWRRLSRKEALGAVSGPSRRALERILGSDDLVGTEFLARAAQRARAVGRIVDRGSGQGFGTGSLISEGLLMTNNHVLRDAAEARASGVQFDYELDVTGMEKPSVTFALEPDRFFVTVQHLDYAIVAVAPRSVTGDRALEDYGSLTFVADDDALVRLAAVVIIQHPLGGYKKIAFRENEVEAIDTPFLRYAADTHQGSSGSPVFNMRLELIALHHTGVPKTDGAGNYLAKDGRPWTEDQGDDAVAWVSNEGILVREIIRDLAAGAGAQGTEPERARRLLARAGGAAPPPEARPSSPLAASVGIQQRGGHAATTSATLVMEAATVRFDLPIEVSVRLGAPVLRAASSAPGAPVGAALDEGAALLERLRRNRARAVAAPEEYYHAAADARARESYYAGVDSGAAPEALYDALSELVTSTHDQPPKYNPSRELYPWVDLHPDGTLRSIYSSRAMDPEEALRHDLTALPRFEAALAELQRREAHLGPEALADEALKLERQAELNCEHVVPQSWFQKQEPMRGDLHHLFACEPRCNSYRGNHPFGGAPGDDERGGPPPDCGELHGERFAPVANRAVVARAVLYFLLRYPGEINRTGPRREYNDQDVAMLLRWSKEAPPSLHERHRNAAIEQRQGNRNPFIDHPEWADRVALAKGLGR